MNFLWVELYILYLNKILGNYIFLLGKRFLQTEVCTFYLDEIFWHGTLYLLVENTFPRTELYIFF